MYKYPETAVKNLQQMINLLYVTLSDEGCVFINGNGYWGNYLYSVPRMEGCT